MGQGHGTHELGGAGAVARNQKAPVFLGPGAEGVGVGGLENRRVAGSPERHRQFRDRAVRRHLQGNRTGGEHDSSPNSSVGAGYAPHQVGRRRRHLPDMGRESSPNVGVFKRPRPRYLSLGGGGWAEGVAFGFGNPFPSTADSLIFQGKTDGGRRRRFARLAVRRTMSMVSNGVEALSWPRRRSSRISEASPEGPVFLGPRAEVGVGGLEPSCTYRHRRKTRARTQKDPVNRRRQQHRRRPDRDGNGTRVMLHSWIVWGQRVHPNPRNLLSM